MEMNEKFYDAILTEGARWLAVLHRDHGKLVVKKEWDNKQIAVFPIFYCFFLHVFTSP